MSARSGSIGGDRSGGGLGGRGGSAEAVQRRDHGVGEQVGPVEGGHPVERAGGDGDAGSVPDPRATAPSRRRHVRRSGRGARHGTVIDEALVPLPPSGRVFRAGRRVRLADADPSGRLRLDSCARYLQDIGNDDTADSGIDDVALTWVVRRAVIDVLRPPRWREWLDLATWCGGLGGRWAERRVEMRGRARRPRRDDHAVGADRHRDQGAGPARRALPRRLRRGGPGSAGVERGCGSAIRRSAPPPSPGRCGRSTST